MSDLVYGLDFGTSNTSLAVSDRTGPARLLPIDPLGEPTTVLPTQVYFGRSATGPFTTVGTQAWRDLLRHGVGSEGRFLFELKAVMGLLERTTVIQGRHRSAVDLVLEVVRFVKARADEAAGQVVKRIVCGRPVAFSDDPAVDQRSQAVLESALEKAGFEEVEFALEPVAADAAVGAADASAAAGVTLTVDIGGGTLDVSVVRRVAGQPPVVLAVSGRPEAGRNVDRRIVYDRLLRPFGKDETVTRARATTGLIPEWILNRVGAWSELHLLAEDTHLNQTLTRLETATKRPIVGQLKRYFRERHGYSFLRDVEHKKIALSDAERARVTFVGAGIVVAEELTRADLRTSLAPLLAAVDLCVDEALKKAGLSTADVDHIERIGGSSRIPAVGERLAQRFGAGKVRGTGSLTAVALGLAELARRHYLLGDPTAPLVRPAAATGDAPPS